MNLVTDATALLVIDMQNAFCHPEGSMRALRGFDISMCQAAVAPCRRLVAAARAAAVPVIYTQYRYAPGYLDGGVRLRELTPGVARGGYLAQGSWDAAMVEELTPAAGERVIEKNRPSAFYASMLESCLRSQRIENLVICGVTTNICVESTARDAAQRDYRTYVVSDATGELERDRHDHALKGLAHMFATIVTVADVERGWAAAA